MRLPLTAVLLAAALFAADDGRYILVVSDDARDLFEVPARANGNTGTVTTGWVPRPGDLRPPTKPLVVKAEWSETGPMTGKIGTETSADTTFFFGEFSLLPGDRTLIPGRNDLGIPPLWIRMIDEPPDCGWGVADVKTTPSIVVLSAGRDGATCFAVIQNVSPKKAVGVSVWEVGQTGMPIVYTTPVPPSATARVLMPKERPAIRAVLFEDGTYEGDPQAAKRIHEKANRAR